MGMMDEAWRESVRRSPEQEKKMTATFTVGEKEIRLTIAINLIATDSDSKRENFLSLSVLMSQALELSEKVCNILEAKNMNI